MFLMSKILQVSGKNKVLREIAKEVPLAEIGAEKINKVLADMAEALFKTKDGVALAAPQIGLSLSIFIVKGEYVETSKEEEQDFKNIEDENIEKKAEEKIIKKEKKEFKPYFFINPQIIKISKKKQTVREGCLSVSGIYGTMERAEKVTIQAYNEKGEKFARGASGLLAQIFQHEMDHLNGALFIDTATDLEKIEK